MSQIISNSRDKNNFLQHKRERETESFPLIITCDKCQMSILRKQTKKCIKCSSSFCSSCQIKQTAKSSVISWACCNCNVINQDSPIINLNRLHSELLGNKNESRIDCGICELETIDYNKFSTVNEVFDYLKANNFYKEGLSELEIRHKSSRFNPPRIFCSDCLSQLLSPPKGSMNFFLSVLDIIKMGRENENENKEKNGDSQGLSLIRGKIFCVVKDFRKKKRNMNKSKKTQVKSPNVPHDKDTLNETNNNEKQQIGSSNQEVKENGTYALTHNDAIPSQNGLLEGNNDREGHNKSGAGSKRKGNGHNKRELLLMDASFKSQNYLFMEINSTQLFSYQILYNHYRIFSNYLKILIKRDLNAMKESPTDFPIDGNLKEHGKEMEPSSVFDLSNILILNDKSYKAMIDLAFPSFNLSDPSNNNKQSNNQHPTLFKINKGE